MYFLIILIHLQSWFETQSKNHQATVQLHVALLATQLQLWPIEVNYMHIRSSLSISKTSHSNHHRKRVRWNESEGEYGKRKWPCVRASAGVHVGPVRAGGRWKLLDLDTLVARASFCRLLKPAPNSVTSFESNLAELAHPGLTLRLRSAPADLRVLSAMPLLPCSLFLAHVKKVKMSSAAAHAGGAATQGGLTYLANERGNHFFFLAIDAEMSKLHHFFQFYFITIIL